MSIENLNQLESFILSNNNMIVDHRNQKPFAQNISTALAWSMAAAYNSSKYFLTTLDKQLDEAETTERADQVRELMTKVEKDLVTIGEAYAWAANFMQTNFDKENELKPTPENIIPTFGEKPESLEAYTPPKEVIEVIKSIGGLSEEMVNLLIVDKQKEMEESRKLMADWSKRNTKSLIAELKMYCDKEKVEFDLTDQIAERMWNKISDKMAAYLQTAFKAMLGKSGRYGLSAMQNAPHYKAAMEEANKWVDVYYNRNASQEMSGDAYGIH
jgi:hypothetical protein